MVKLPKRPHIFIGEKLPAPSPRVYNPGGTSFKRTSYQAHANQIFKEAAQLKAIFSQLQGAAPSDRIYYRVELPKEFAVASGKGAELEESVHAEIVGSPSRSVSHVSSSKQSFDLLFKQLENYKTSEKNVGKSNFASIQHIGGIPLNEKLTLRYRRSVKSKGFDGRALISLFPDLTKKERESYLQLIGALLRRERGELIGQYDSETGLFLSVKASEKTIEKIAETFLAVQSVDSADELLVPSSTSGDIIDSSIIVKVNDSAAIVCVFDTGVADKSRLLDGSVLSRENPLGPPHDVDHGTFVASRIIYGDSLRDQIAEGALTPNVKVRSVCLVAHDGIGNRKPIGTEVIMRVVRETVEKYYREIKVYNLSMNLVSSDPLVISSIGDDTVNALSAELDNLSKKYDVIFVVSAGNYPPPNGTVPTKPYPKYFDEEDTRICPPAEANLAITVGSVTDRENAGSMCKKGVPSPFTRRGPGFAGYRKPDLIAHGGNYGQRWFATISDLSVAGIGKVGDRVCYGNGTSYAAPLVSRLAAHLFATIPNASSSLVRAMLIHFATLPSSEGLSQKKLIELVGNGLPSPESLLNSNPWEQSFLYQGDVDYRKIHSIPFFVPKALLQRKGKAVVGVRLTIAFNSETDRTLSAGYCKTHLRTHLEKIDSKGKRVDVQLGKHPVNINNMYSTVIRREHTFASGVRPGDWAVTVEQITRWKLRDIKTPFGLVLTLFDPKREQGIDIYQMIQSEVPNRYKNELNVRTQIRL